MTLNVICTQLLSFLPVFQCFRRVHNRSSKIIVCCRVLACDSGRESESAKFYRFQLRLKPERSTPTDSNSGLDSDSAALVAIITMMQVQSTSVSCIANPKMILKAIGGSDRAGECVIACQANICKHIPRYIFTDV